MKGGECEDIPGVIAVFIKATLLLLFLYHLLHANMLRSFIPLTLLLVVSGQCPAPTTTVTVAASATTTISSGTSATISGLASVCPISENYSRVDYAKGTGGGRILCSSLSHNCCAIGPSKYRCCHITRRNGQSTFPPSRWNDFLYTCTIS